MATIKNAEEGSASGDAMRYVGDGLPNPITVFSATGKQ
jgi:hypothetical protein